MIPTERLARPLKHADAKAALARYLSDESTKDIAESYGITRQALGQWLLKTAEQEWKDAQVARAIARKEQADEEIEGAADILSLGRAREKLRSAQWDLERVCRRIYGQDQPPPGSAVQINIMLRRDTPNNPGNDSQLIVQVPDKP